MMPLRERYNTDNHFKSLVDMMSSYIYHCYFSPSEVREAAILASIIYEERNIRQMVIVDRETEEALRVIRKKVEEICTHEWMGSPNHKICVRCGAEKGKCDHQWRKSAGYDVCKLCGSKRLGRG